MSTSRDCTLNWLTNTRLDCELFDIETPTRIIFRYYKIYFHIYNFSYFGKYFKMDKVDFIFTTLTVINKF